MERLEASGVLFEVGQPDPDAAVSSETLLAGVRAHDVLLCMLTERVDRSVLEANGRLRGVAVMAVGLDSVDLDAAESLGIPVRGTPSVLTDATADLAFGLLLATARRIPAAHRYMVEGRYERWGAELFCGLDVSPGASGRRKTLGIVGYGRIGRAVARRARGFDLDVVALARGADRTPGSVDGDGTRFVALEELLGASDFVSIHTPLTAETRHLFGAEEFARMKPTAILVNTARGPVVDEAALVDALRRGELAGAGLDVYEDEPRMAPGLDALPNVVLLPHIGSATEATRGHMACAAVDNAVALHGGPDA